MTEAEYIKTLERRVEFLESFIKRFIAIRTYYQWDENRPLVCIQDPIMKKRKHFVCRKVVFPCKLICGFFGEFLPFHT